MKFGLFVAAAIVAHSNNKAAAGYIRRGVVQPEGMNHRDLLMEEIDIKTEEIDIKTQGGVEIQYHFRDKEFGDADTSDPTSQVFRDDEYVDADPTDTVSGCIGNVTQPECANHGGSWNSTTEVCCGEIELEDLTLVGRKKKRKR